jgi:mono/diheme cytochrome c family protein
MIRIPWKKLGVFGLGLGVAIQLVPYGREHTNPSVVEEPQWSSPDVRALAVRACFDCHSNETSWPWYANVAPVSWLVQKDTDDGRRHLNFSEWNRKQKHAKDAAEEVSEGEMPMPIYLVMHADARLTDPERQQLVDGLRATFGTDDTAHDDD